MTDCKYYPYTDEYCASGDYERDNNLTEQWKKGELPEGVYYCNTGNTVEILFTWEKNYHQLTNNKDEVYIPEMDDCDEIIAPVPSYEKWQLMQDNNKRLKHDVGNLGYKIKNQRKEIERQIAQNKELKDEIRFLKEVGTINEVKFKPFSQRLLEQKIKDCDRLKKQLAIAVEALKWYDGLEKMLIGWEIATGQERGTAEKALQHIKELEK